MKKQRLPKSWTGREILELAKRHDEQSEEQQAAEIEAAMSAKEIIDNKNNDDLNGVLQYSMKQARRIAKENPF